MHAQTPIIVSSRDMDRLENLLESPAYRQGPDLDALRQELERANVVAPDKIPVGVITMNSIVRFVDEANGDEHEMTLVYPRDADGSDGKVSVFAPVGSALLGLSVGQTIEWPAPGNRKLRLRVLSVSYQPEAAGAFHR